MRQRKRISLIQVYQRIHRELIELSRIESLRCAVFGRGATGTKIFSKNEYVGMRMVRDA